MYTEKVMDHFKNPRNVGEIEGASGVGTVGNAKCGDIMQIFLDIDENEVARVALGEPAVISPRGAAELPAHGIHRRQSPRAAREEGRPRRIPEGILALFAQAGVVPS